jgi:hypothetical protein
MAPIAPMKSSKNSQKFDSDRHSLKAAFQFNAAQSWISGFDRLDVKLANVFFSQPPRFVHSFKRCLMHRGFSNTDQFRASGIRIHYQFSPPPSGFSYRTIWQTDPDLFRYLETPWQGCVPGQEHSGGSCL